MANSKLAGIPKDAGRDMTVFLKSVRDILTELTKESVGDKKYLASRNYLLRVNKQTGKSIIEQINESLVLLDSKLSGVIDTKVNNLSTQTGLDIEAAKVVMRQEITDAIAANNVTLTNSILAQVDQKILDNNASLMIEVGALIDSKIAEQHPPVP